MNARNLIGVLLCVVLFAVAFATADGAGQFLNGMGLLIVVSGTLGATLLSYPFDCLQNAVRVGWNSYTGRPPSSREIVESLLTICVHSRYDGIQSLEKFEKETTVAFLRTALEMMVDGYRKQELREMLQTEMAFFRQRRLQHERVFRHMARLAPAFGVAGSVIGLMAMLFGVGDTGVILRTIPLALTSTLYGIVLSNFLLTPVAESIHFKTLRELLIKKLVLDGCEAILDERNPHQLEKRLESFLTPAARRSRQRSLAEIRELYEQRRAEARAAATS